MEPDKDPDQKMKELELEARQGSWGQGDRKLRILEIDRAGSSETKIKMTGETPERKRERK